MGVSPMSRNSEIRGRNARATRLMARKKPAPKTPSIDDFKALMCAMQKDLSRLHKQATAELTSCQAAVEFACQYRKSVLPGATTLLPSRMRGRQILSKERLRRYEWLPSGQIDWRYNNPVCTLPHNRDRLVPS